ncbi:hypothetical protein ACOSQ3_013318 [Xanthoceras sorbifolium]
MSSSIDHEHHEADTGVSPPKDHRSCSFHEVVNEYKQFVSQQRAMDCNYGAVRPMEVRSRCFLVVRRLGGPKESPQRFLPQEIRMRARESETFRFLLP